VAEVLIVDDEPSIREFLLILMKRLGHRASATIDVPEAKAILDKQSFDLVLTDLKLPNGNGLDVLKHTVEKQPTAQVIVMTAFATTETAIEAMKLGAYDYVLKPFQVDEISVMIERALERRELRAENKALKKTLADRVGRSRLLGSSPAMKQVFTLIGKVAPTKTTLLITGESGTGKELVSRAVHSRGPRENEPFVAINCGAIPEQLIESELFGHKKGSFTGAHIDKAGLFEMAGAGTVFLDEIGELPLAMQVRLLRVLQERRVRRIGEAQDQEIKCRVIAATNRDLLKEVDEGRFREDLYFRLNVIQMRLPSLRERRDDIPVLAQSFIARFCEDQQSKVDAITADAMTLMVDYDWPGNVRELENVIERGVTLAAGNVLDVDALPPQVSGKASERFARVNRRQDITKPTLPEEGLDLELLLNNIERQMLNEALERTGGKKKKAAELLGLSFRSFRYRLSKLGLSDNDEL